MRAFRTSQQLALGLIIMAQIVLVLVCMGCCLFRLLNTTCVVSLLCTVSVDLVPLCPGPFWDHAVFENCVYETSKIHFPGVLLSTPRDPPSVWYSLPWGFPWEPVGTLVTL